MDQLTQAKLTLLKIASQKCELSRDEIIATALATLTMDYFTATEVLASLCSDGFIVPISPLTQPLTNALGKTIEWLSLTKAGEDVLHTLEPHLTDGAKHFLEKQLQADTIIEANAPTASLVELADKTYEVDLRMTATDANPLKLQLKVPTRDLALSLIALWRNDAHNKYALLMDLLFMED